MKLYSKIPLFSNSNNLIDYNSKTLLIGSCFSENIGSKLDYFKFQNVQNPFGILFHPKAIEALICNAIEGKRYTENDIFKHNEQWHCFNAHSKLSDTSKRDLLEVLNAQVEVTQKQIQESSHIIITLGTSWVYRFLESNQIVANCHKVPQKQFKKELLTIEEIYQSLDKIVSLIASVNKAVVVIFTVSPVRHLKDGFVENTQSKSHLISAIHQFLHQKSSITNLNSFYFPSYEIMMDELRDYRFYAEDMIHPNQTAINYIWEKFLEVWVHNDAKKVMSEVDHIQKAMGHKPFNPNSEAHKKFLQNLEQKKNNLSKWLPNISF